MCGGGCVAINIHPKCPLEIFARPQFVIAIYRSMSLSKDNFASVCPWELLTPATLEVHEWKDIVVI